MAVVAAGGSQGLDRLHLGVLGQCEVWCNLVCSLVQCSVHLVRCSMHFGAVQFTVNSAPEYLRNAAATCREPGTCQTALVSPGAGWAE